ncbi:MAG: 16S rRNA (uracil(1498)-N(3))-methyltransferase [Oscillospiraceae bacterium]|nr:16S rRNA (uracil(1498)-N(3))-methyltransferase [Oscillospiraceae bacterium]
MTRFFIDTLPREGRVALNSEEKRHLASLRMREGDRVVLCDGHSLEAVCRLTDGGEAEILEFRASRNEPTIRVHLYPSVAKGERFEWMLQKATELGVTSVTPVLSERCVAAAPSAEKAERFRRIIKSAAEQSGRGILPELRNPLAFNDVMTVAEGKKLFCYEEETEKSLKSALTRESGLINGVSLLTGPEGGYSPYEATEAVKNGWESVSLGGCILRCETAPIAVLSVIRYLEMSG